MNFMKNLILFMNNYLSLKNALICLPNIKLIF